jgi:hypothetical protein
VFVVPGDYEARVHIISPTALSVHLFNAVQVRYQQKHLRFLKIIYNNSFIDLMRSLIVM